MEALAEFGRDVGGALGRGVQSTLTKAPAYIRGSEQGIQDADKQMRLQRAQQEAQSQGVNLSELSYPAITILAKHGVISSEQAMMASARVAAEARAGREEGRKIGAEGRTAEQQQYNISQRPAQEARATSIEDRARAQEGRAVEQTAYGRSQRPAQESGALAQMLSTQETTKGNVQQQRHREELQPGKVADQKAKTAYTEALTGQATRAGQPKERSQHERSTDIGAKLNTITKLAGKSMSWEAIGLTLAGFTAMCYQELDKLLSRPESASWSDDKMLGWALDAAASNIDPETNPMAAEKIRILKGYLKQDEATSGNPLLEASPQGRFTEDGELIMP